MADLAERIVARNIDLIDDGKHMSFEFFKSEIRNTINKVQLSLDVQKKLLAKYPDKLQDILLFAGRIREFKGGRKSRRKSRRSKRSKSKRR